MKVAVINYTGTVGKTTIVAHLLSPRMKGASIYSIESINQAADALGLDVEKLRGDKFRELLNKLMTDEDALIDVGASNVEDFMNNLEGFEGAHEEIDYFVIPVTSGTKEQQETISMVEALLSFGIPGHKVRIIYNRVQRNVISEFPIMINYYHQKQGFWMNSNCAIFETELFDAVSVHAITITGLLEDETDFKGLLRDKEASPVDRACWSDLYGLKLLAKGVNRKLDQTFDLLFS